MVENYINVISVCRQFHHRTATEMWQPWLTSARLQFVWRDSCASPPRTTRFSHQSPGPADSSLVTGIKPSVSWLLKRLLPDLTSALWRHNVWCVTSWRLYCHVMASAPTCYGVCSMTLALWIHDICSMTSLGLFCDDIISALWRHDVLYDDSSMTSWRPLYDLTFFMTSRRSHTQWCHDVCCVTS